MSEMRDFGEMSSDREVYFGGAGVNTSRRLPGAGFGLGLGAFLVSFLPLSLFPMRDSVTYSEPREKTRIRVQ